ncbi:DUF5819 family protein [Streptacidiphilus neutrinimicus]|uniref:DUF5819 family protein n=1 Tax=Streptacidiphilus neutrinimicus TaxID=105420 RepID=UPI0006933064|nr:DUF5819 family protein [Streptacidiphilus neutrinimicus]
MADEPDGATTHEPIPGPRTAPDEADPADGRTDGSEDAEAEPEAEDAGPGRRWSLPSLLVLYAAVIAVAVAVVYHLGAVFLSIAPGNPISQRNAATVNAHVMPEFEQNWQLFAPNPLQQNIAIQARVQTLDPNGARAQSPWIDLTAQDVAAIHGNPFPSHVNQNLLRRAWDYYSAWHDQNEKSTGFGGPLSVEYLKRIGLQRIGRDWHGEPVIQIQFRSATTDVTGPTWTGAPATTSPSYRLLPWWPATDDDYSGLGVS